MTDAESDRIDLLRGEFDTHVLWVKDSHRELMKVMTIHNASQRRWPAWLGVALLTMALSHVGTFCALYWLVCHAS